MNWNILDRAPRKSGGRRQLEEGCLRPTASRAEPWEKNVHVLRKNTHPQGLPMEKLLWINYIGRFWVRPADAAGKTDWIKMIENGMSLFQVAEGFADSAEYREEGASRDSP